MELGTPHDGLCDASAHSQSWWRKKAVSGAGNFEGRKPQKKTQVTSLDGAAEPYCHCYPADAKSSLSPNQKNLFMHKNK